MEFFDNPEIFKEIKGLDIRVSAAYDCCLDANWHCDFARAAFNRIYFVYGGQGRVVCGGEEFVLTPGNIYFFPADTDFSYSCSHTVSKIYFHVNVFRWNRYDLLSGTSGIAFENRAEDVEKIRRLWKRKDTLSALELKTVITDLVCAAALKNGVGVETKAVNNQLVKKAINMIESEMRCTVTAASLAEKLFVSESWLQRVFKEEVGVTLGKYINDRVLFTAQEMLRYSALSVKDVSEKLGFCDQFYFSKVFKARFGLSPIKYRKNVCT